MSHFPECPFLSTPQVEFCQRVPSLRNLETATTYCLANYEQCPLYRMQVALAKSEALKRKGA